MSDSDGPRRKVGHSRKRPAESQLSKMDGDKSCKMINSLPKNNIPIFGVKGPLTKTNSHKTDPQFNTTPSSSNQSFVVSGQTWFSSSFSRKPAESTSNATSVAKTCEEIRNVVSNTQTKTCDSRNILETGVVAHNTILERRLERDKTGSFQTRRIKKASLEDSGMDLLDESLKDDDLLKEIEEMEDLVVCDSAFENNTHSIEKENCVENTKNASSTKTVGDKESHRKQACTMMQNVPNVCNKKEYQHQIYANTSVPSGGKVTDAQSSTSNETVNDSLNIFLNESYEITSSMIETKSKNRINTSTPKSNATPSRSVSLSERIKQRLHANVSVSPHGQSALAEQARTRVLLQAQSEAARIQQEGTEVDIGPFYGLPSKVKQLLESQRGIKQLYDWQDACLRLPAVMQGKNLIYSLPTSGGKTLVAEILILRELLCKKRDAMLILPFVSIVQEKVRTMSHFAVDLDFLIEEYAGSKGRFPPLKRRKKKSLFIATIEKSHSLVNSLIEGGRLDSIGLVVVDELHMLGEGGSRGATLETTLVKLLQAGHNIQVIGMSATLNNIEDLQVFLKAEVYTNDFRPVDLTENIKLDDTIYKVNNKTLCPEDRLVHERVVTFQYSPDMTKVDPDHLLGLVLEVIPSNSCLLFCPTKKNCENVAMMLCKLMVKHKRHLSEVNKKERKELLYEIYNDGNGKMCPVLQYTIHFGVAYHHSGLTMDERRLIEDAYSDGTLCLLTCTSTLAAGVNLPAKRVILRNCYVGSNFISRSQYKQMVGRAGRAGIDSSGESILITSRTDREKVLELMNGQIESCHSSLLYDEGKGIRSLLLTTIGLKVTQTTEEVFDFCRKTLLSVQSESLQCDVAIITKECVEKLIQDGLVVQKKSEENQGSTCSLDVTPLGRATFKGSVDIAQANSLYSDLRKAKESLVLTSYLHLLYLVTPYEIVRDIRPVWSTYFTQMNILEPEHLKVAILVGVPESYIAKKASGQTSKQAVNELTVSRFYLTLILFDLWQQKTLWEVAEKYQLPRGFIQNLLSSAASFASCVLRFCEELDEFWAFQQLMGDFVKRLTYCVTADLIPLMEIPGVKLGRAKQLYNAGCKTLAMVANADPKQLVNHIKKIPKKSAEQIVMSAKSLLNEKTEALLEEVENMVTIPEHILTQSILTPGLQASMVAATPEQTDTQGSQTSLS